jgi:hypothetical protein
LEGADSSFGLSRPREYLLFTVHFLYLFFVNKEVFQIGNFSFCGNYTYLGRLRHLFGWICKDVLDKDNFFRQGWQRDLHCIYREPEKSIDHLFLICPIMSKFWHTFNSYNFRHLSLPVTSDIDMWSMVSHLPPSNKLYAFSLISVVLRVRRNYRNRFIFKHSSAPSFNSFILKVSDVFSILGQKIQFHLSVSAFTSRVTCS